ncbi:hypothetical protein ACRQ1B_20140, partial [Rhizobium panacihumi]|uniref:hypothetical protein n=1 Tax=Rhizobium panacihumi TaxID=2008450 RepID=UPI003D7B68ED
GSNPAPATKTNIPENLKKPSQQNKPRHRAPTPSKQRPNAKHNSDRGQGQFSRFHLGVRSA